MDFTRQPIIETVISPKEGYKLLIRNSKEANQEEYLVPALEIVSFGNALFFRCLERKPKAFLLPIADYDVVEVKESRLVLKNVSTDKPIKIAETKPAKESGDSSKEEASGEVEPKKGNKKRHSKKRRSSKSTDKEPTEKTDKEEEPKAVEEKKQTKETKNNKPSKQTKPTEKKETESHDKTKKEGKVESVEAPPVVSVIFPPPPKIIGRKMPQPDSEENKPNVESADKKEPTKDSKHEDSKVAHSKDLPPLDEVKEVSESKKAHHSSSEESKE